MHSKRKTTTYRLLVTVFQAQYKADNLEVTSDPQAVHLDDEVEFYG
jgi:hypothetical protein